MGFIDFWIIFLLSFTTALSGALSPGPLLTYTVMHSIKDRKSGYLAGFRIITGHAILESAILIVIIIGFTPLLSNAIFVRIISVIGCIFLLFFGISLFIDIAKKKVSLDFLEAENDNDLTGRKPELHPIIGGILVSMSNPYWWLWWAGIGGTFLAKYNITLADPVKIIAFFLGHEAGDLAWYAPVSILAHFGRKKINKTIYSVILVFCGIFMIGFGLFLAMSAFIESPKG
jgi:threonine/homoserine/homoserine lactone efflux protein